MTFRLFAAQHAIRKAKGPKPDAAPRKSRPVADQEPDGFSPIKARRSMASRLPVTLVGLGGVALCCVIFVGAVGLVVFIWAVQP